MIGNVGVGKTCLLQRFASDSFSANYITTIGVDFCFRTLNVDGHTVKLQIVRTKQWDTAGQERFRSLTKAYFRWADGAMIHFDRTSQKSFDDVEEWLQEVNCTASAQTVKLLVGNKTDLEVVVDSVVARTKAERLGMNYVETSAKSAYQVESAFRTIAMSLVTRRSAEVSEASHRSVSLLSAQKRRSCC